jgi:DNA-binding MarR family transcriptional regulator
MSQTAQADLFDLINARRTDPVSSAMADDESKASGTRKRSLDLVVGFLYRHPKKTSRELAAISQLDRHEVARRLSDLKKAGLATHSPRPRPDTAGGRPGVEWWLTHTGQMEAHRCS